MPKLSVIVPSLTGHVPQSLRGQAAGREDVELVVVRGVSPVGKARNAGLARATGEYVAWVDADDEVAADWLDEIFKALETKPDVVVIGHKWMTDAAFGFEKAWRGGDLLGDVLRQDAIFGELWNKVTRRELWDGVRFDDGARTMEDWAVLPSVLAGVRRVVAVERPLYLYFARPGSLTHRTDEATQREVFARALGRIDDVRRLGLWKKYGRVTMAGVAYAVYCCAETLSLGGPADSPTRREAERWIRRRLPTLLVTPSRMAYKVKWILAALGWWGAVRWHYAKIQGRKL